MTDLDPPRTNLESRKNLPEWLEPDALNAAYAGEAQLPARLSTASLDGAYAGENGLPARLSDATLSSTFVPKWKATTAYLTGDKVLNPAGDVVSAKVDFTSGASYSSANWDISATYTTPAQAAGLSAALSIVFGG